MSSVKEKVMSGLIWKFAERISAQLVTFFVSIILARLLTPEHYGAIALVTIFITLANVFVESGFGNSLIQKKDADETDFSSVFYFSVMMSIVMYVIVYISAPYFAKFYSMPILSPVLRVMGLRLIVAGINSVQHAYVARHMLFKRFFWSTLGGTIASGVVGIAMAYMGLGIWALVAQYMVNTTVDTIVLFITVKWKPRLLFSFKRLAQMFSYGWKLLLSGIIETGYNELRSLVIGKLYTASDLAFYNKGQGFPELIVTNVNTSIQSVLFPAMANLQEKKDQVKAMCRRAIRISSYIMLPMMTGLALVAESFVKLLLTEKWLPCVPFLRVACFMLALRPIHTANLQAIKAMGRSDIFLKLEIIKKIIGLAVLVCVARHGVMAIAISALFVTVMCSIVNAYPNKNLINYTYKEQIQDLFSPIVPLLFMVIFVYPLGFLPAGSLLKISLQVAVGAVVYPAASYLLKNETFNYLLSMVMELFGKKRGTQEENIRRTDILPHGRKDNEMNDICYKELILEDAHLLSEFLKSADRLFPIPLSEKQNLDVLTQKLLLSGKVVGAYYEKNLIGAICGYANDTENRCAYISVLCVLPDFQGKSVARNLLMKFIEISKQQMMNTVFLYTHHTNQRAVRLYEKSGFSPVPSDREGDIKLVLKFRR